MTRRAIIVAATALWFACVGTGLRVIWGYSTTAGAQDVTPKSWPTASTLPRGPGFTVVMFVHPECPCSRASLGELAVIAESAPAASFVVAVAGEAPSGLSWDLAGRVAGVRRVLDPDGAEARRFGAQTSGHVVVFAADGSLRYAGGITGSRGHVGKNVGRDYVVEILREQRTSGEHAVFGCAIARAPQ